MRTTQTPLVSILVIRRGAAFRVMGRRLAKGPETWEVDLGARGITSIPISEIVSYQVIGEGF